MIPLALIFSAALAASGGPSADDFVGRWNVLITDADNTFASGGFRIDRDGNGLAAGVVWRSGSYLPASAVTLENGVLTIVREDEPGKKEVFEVRAIDGMLKGKVTYSDGKVHHFEGRPAPSLTTTAQTEWGEPVTLFDGKTLDGWKLRDPKAKNGWAVVDGELAVVAPKGNADLVSERAFQDMKLHLEFNVDAPGNSGVYLRGRYEIQIESHYHSAYSPAQKSGSLYSRVAPYEDATREPGEWQTFDVTFVGRRLQLKLNGRLVIDTVVDGITGGAISPWEEEPGPLMLQGDHGRIRFRNIVVTPAR